MKGEYIFYIPLPLWVTQPCHSVAPLSFPLPSGGLSELILFLVDS